MGFPGGCCSGRGSEDIYWLFGEGVVMVCGGSELRWQTILIKKNPKM